MPRDDGGDAERYRYEFEIQVSGGVLKRFVVGDVPSTDGPLAEPVSSLVAWAGREADTINASRP